jgi:hypothetical protein
MNLPLGSTIGKIETRGRKTVYTDSERQVPKVIRLAANQPCGRLLEPMIAVWLPHYERRQGRVGKAVRKRLETVSPCSINRLPAPVKASKE